MDWTLIEEAIMLHKVITIIMCVHVYMYMVFCSLIIGQFTESS